jgi:two-component system chemotaxis sensor kinase CheA
MNDKGERAERRRVTFVHDAHQRLATLSASLLSLERDPTDQTALNEALRALHTLKGNAGFVGLETLVTIAHALEEVLTKAAHSPTMTSGYIPHTLLVRGLDALSAMVAALAETVHQAPPPVPVIETLMAAFNTHRPTAHSESRTIETNASPTPSPHQPRITVSTSHLDDLLELAKELGINHRELAQAETERQGLFLIRQRRLLHELHNVVLQTRLLPIDQAFDGFDRLVRDLAERLGRQARLVIEGAGMEIDRSILQPLRELVVHLLHNALAHGLEPSDERAAAGKPSTGTIQLATRFHRNGVIVEVADDGRGLDRQQVAARAVALGLCTTQEAAEMEDAELWMLLTRPGFSTQERIDRISGRGMGLNAVRQGIEALHGHVEITSQPGIGTVFHLWLPVITALTALEEVVLVQIGTEIYAIPQAFVDRARPAQETENLPVIDLQKRLRVPGYVPPPDHMLLVCQRSRGQVGLLVDAIVGREAAVISPLPKRVQRPDLLGAIVTDHRQVVLVLDVERL